MKTREEEEEEEEEKEDEEGVEEEEEGVEEVEEGGRGKVKELPASNGGVERSRLSGWSAVEASFCRSSSVIHMSQRARRSGEVETSRLRSAAGPAAGLRKSSSS